MICKTKEMKKLKNIFYALFIVTTLNACSDDEEIDTQKPVIDISISDAFPAHCSDIIYFGEPFTLRLKFSDNAELGTYSINIHNNFDHHSHSTEVTECELEAVKTPDNPFSLIEDYELPEGQTEYVTDLVVNVPSSGTNGRFDEGNYHFQISLADKEGWSTLYGIGVKMAYRED